MMALLPQQFSVPLAIAGVLGLAVGWAASGRPGPAAASSPVAEVTMPKSNASKRHQSHGSPVHVTAQWMFGRYDLNPYLARMAPRLTLFPGDNLLLSREAREAVYSLSLPDVRRVVAELEGLPDSAQKSASLHDLFWYFALHSPREFLEGYRADKRPELASGLVNAIDQIGRVDIDRALLELQMVDQVRSDVRPAALRMLVTDAPGSQAREAYSLLSQLGLDERVTQRPQALYRLIELDPAAAYGEVMSLSPGYDRREFLSALANRKLQDDAQACIAWANALPDATDRREALEGALNAWAYQDPGAALAWVQAQPRPLLPVVENASRQMARQLARIDPAAAAQWAGSVPGPDSITYIYSVISEWARSDPAAAAAFALHHLTEGVQSDALLDIMTKWRESDPAAALQFAGQALTGKLQEVHLAGALESYATSSPELAKAYVEHIPAGPLHSTLTVSLATALSAIDPAAAADWLETQPIDDPASAHAWGQVAATWSGADLTTAADWLGTLPPGLPRDEAIAAWSRNAERVDPALAMQWIDQMSPGAKRLSTQNEILANWTLRDPKAAAAWARKKP